MGARFVELSKSAQSATPGEHPGLSNEVWLGYNVDGDLLEIMKNIGGIWFKRIIDDPDISDNIVSRWVKYLEYETV